VLSGAGLASRMLYDEIPKGADPMGPENVLCLASGVLTGTGAQMSGRWIACAKSPLTGGWGEANGGGTFAPAIKRCGYDAIIFKGKSDAPVYLAVSGGKAELRDASGLWGLDTVETEEAILKETGDKNMRVACIGPSGERLSLIAGIVNEGARIAARSGIGAVMGSKNLKAVALSGKERVEAADRKKVAELSKEFARWVREGDKAGKYLGGRINRIIARFMRISPFGFGASGDMIRVVMRAYGTIVTNVISAETGDSPVKNWKGAGTVDFPMSTHSDRLNPARIIEHQRERYHCYSCPIGCGGKMDLTGKTRFNLSETHKPEYETASAFGSLVLNNDLDALFYINDILNRAGMDCISAGSSVAFAMECYESGILTRDDLDGIDLTWGNAEAIIELVEKMILREGIGDVLADGSKAAAKKIGKGSGELAMHAGGQDLAMHDGRLDPGYAVGYNMEPTPGRHTNISYLYLEMYALDKIFKGLPEAEMLYRKSGRYSVEGRERLLVAASKFIQLVNGSGVCLFGVQCGPRYPFIDYLNAVTGWGLSPDEYLEIGERIQHQRQAFNVKHGRKARKDFALPKRAIGVPPLDKGPLKGATVPIDELNRNFAKEMGWDEEGRPLPSRLRELGLDRMADDVEKAV